MTTPSTTRAVERCEQLARLGPAPAWWRAFALRRWLAEYRAIMALDISAQAEMLRQVYTLDVVKLAAQRPHPALRMAMRVGSTPWIEPIEYPGEVRIVSRDLERGTVEYEEP